MIKTICCPELIGKVCPEADICPAQVSDKTNCFCKAKWDYYYGAGQEDSKVCA